MGSSYETIKKLGQGAFGGVYLIKKKINFMLLKRLRFLN